MNQATAVDCFCASCRFPSPRTQGIKPFSDDTCLWSTILFEEVTHERMNGPSLPGIRKYAYAVGTCHLPRFEPDHKHLYTVDVEYTDSFYTRVALLVPSTEVMGSRELLSWGWNKCWSGVSSTSRRQQRIGCHLEQHISFA